MNKKFLTSNTYDHTVHSLGETNDEPTMTVPDQSLTIPEILDMFTRGIDVSNLYKEPVGYDDPDFDDVDPTQDPTFDVLTAKLMLDETRSKLLDQLPDTEPSNGDVSLENKTENVE